MPVHFIGGLTKEKFLAGNGTLCKYMPLEHALASVEERYLYLASPAEWKDPYERRFIDNKYSDESEYPLKGKILCTCFSGLIVSEAHWTVYSGDHIGVCFRVNRQKLFDYYNDFSINIYIGLVRYQTTKQIQDKLSKNEFLMNNSGEFDLGDKETQLKLLLLKRKAFSYEEEVRIFVETDKVKTYSKNTKINKVQCEWQKIVSSVYLDPRIGKKTENMLKSKFKELGFKQVFKSQIYSKDKNTIIEI